MASPAYSPTENHNSCVNTRAIIDYIDRHYGRASEVIAGVEDYLSGVSDPQAFLCDPHNWVPSEVCRRMFANAREISGRDEVAFQIGFESVTHKSLGYIQEIFLRAWATPHSAVSRLKTINDKFNRNKELEVLDHTRTGAVVRLHWRKDLDLGEDFCLMNKGVYSAIPIIWGLPPAKVQESCCQFKGGDYCEFVLSWKNPSILERLFIIPRKQYGLLAATLNEIERDKQLLQEKHDEVSALNKSLQHKINQLLSIQQASRTILSELDYKKLYSAVLNMFVMAIGHTRGMIMLVDEQAGMLRYQEGVGAGSDDLGRLHGYEVSLKRTSNLLVQVALSGQPFICHDVTRLNLNPENIIVSAYQPKSIVILPLIAQGKIKGLLAADRQEGAADHNYLDLDYMQVFANQVSLAMENARMYRDLKESYLSTVRSLASALEAKDTYTRGHSDRVTQFATQLATRLDLDPTQIEQIKRVTILHDIGKIGVDRSLLNLARPLSDTERKIVQQHPLIGQNIVAPMRLSSEEISIVRNHHERYDGRGYPDGLTGGQLPIQVRVVSVADAFDAMTSDRPYRAALQVRQAIHQLQKGAGSQFDPLVVDVLIDMVHRGMFRDLLVGPIDQEPVLASQVM